MIRDTEGTVYVGLLAGHDTASDDVPFPIIELYKAGIRRAGTTKTVLLPEPQRLLIPLSRVAEITTARKREPKALSVTTETAQEAETTEM